MQTFDVIIVGGGMVGASLALALDQAGLKTALVDQQSLQPATLPINAPWQARVSALTEASVKLFKYLGAWEGMVAQRVCPYTHMAVWDGEGTGEVAFDAESMSYNQLGYIVENEVIRNALLQQLAVSNVQSFGGQASLEYSLSTTSQGGDVTLANGDVLQAPLLVAGDGAESALRRLSGIASNQKDYKHHAIVTTVETELAHHHCARQAFLDTGPLAFLPLQGQHYCSIVWSLTPATADRIEALSDAAFCHELERAFEGRAGKILHADKRLRFPLRQRHARQYHRQGVVLVGDAAHTIHPLAGQGANLGFMDAAVLAEELARAQRRGDDFFAPHILNRYQRRRKAHNTAMMLAMAGFQNLFAADNPGIRWARNTGLKLTNRLPLLKELFVQQAMGDTPMGLR